MKKQQKNLIINVLGWVGVSAVIVGYGLITFEVVTAEDLTYIMLNILGASGLIISSYHKRDMQPVALNIIWLLIALIGLVGLI